MKRQTPKEFAKTLGDLDRSLERRVKRRKKAQTKEFTLPDGTKFTARLHALPEDGIPARTLAQTIADPKVQAEIRARLKKTLSEMTPEEVQAEIEKAGQRRQGRAFDFTPPETVDCACGRENCSGGNGYAREKLILPTANECENQDLIQDLAFGDDRLPSFEKKLQEAKTTMEGRRTLTVACLCLIPQTRRLYVLAEALSEFTGTAPEDLLQRLDEALDD